MEPEQKSNGAFVGLVVIVLLLIIGGIYIWQANKENLKPLNDLNSSTLSGEDSSELDSLEMSASSIDATTGVDASSVN